MYSSLWMTNGAVYIFTDEHVDPPGMSKTGFHTCCCRQVSHWSCSTRVATKKENPWHTLSYNNHLSFVNSKDSQVSWWKREPLVLSSGIYDGMSTRRSAGPPYTLMIPLWVPLKAMFRHPHSCSISVRDRNLFGAMTGCAGVEVFRGKMKDVLLLPTLSTCACCWARIDMVGGEIVLKDTCRRVVGMDSKRPQVLQQTEGFEGFLKYSQPIRNKWFVNLCFYKNGIKKPLVNG